MKKFRCPLCCDCELHCSDLKEHIRAYAKGKLECPICHSYANGISHLLIHLDTHHSDTILKSTSVNPSHSGKVSTVELNPTATIDETEFLQFTTKKQIQNAVVTSESTMNGKITSSGSLSKTSSEDELNKHGGNQLALDGENSFELITSETLNDLKIIGNSKDTSDGKMCHEAKRTLALISSDSEIDLGNDIQCDPEQETVANEFVVAYSNVLCSDGLVQKSVIYVPNTYLGSMFLYTCGMCSECFGTIKLLQEHAKNVHSMIEVPLSNEQSVTSKEGTYKHSGSESNDLQEGDTEKGDTEVTLAVQPIHKTFKRKTLHNSVPINIDNPEISDQEVRKRFKPETNHLQEHIADNASTVALSSIQNTSEGTKQNSTIPTNIEQPKIQVQETRKQFETNTNNSQECSAEEVSPVRKSLPRTKQNEPRYYIERKVDLKMDTIKRTCEVCDKTFQTYLSYKVHFYTHKEPQDWPLGCGDCDERFIVKEALTKHLKATFHKEKCVMCDLCKKSFRTMELYEDHMGMVHNKKPQRNMSHKCDKCSASFEESSSLSIHKEKVHQEQRASNYLCRWCGKKYSVRTHLIAHQSSAHHDLVGNDASALADVRLHCCTICGKSFSTMTVFNYHMTKHGDVRSHTCDICSKVFLTSTLLREHYELHTGEKPHKCDKCGEVFRYGQTLRNHLLQHSEEKQIKCVRCDKEFQSVDCLYVHMRTHNESVKCDECDSIFKSKSLMLAHKDRDHLQEVDTGDYECPLCVKKFFLKSQLTSHHIVVHEKAHVCLSCERSFTTKRLLKSHMRTHIKVRPHVCDICNRNFINSNLLEGHRQLHTITNPNECDVCKESFPTWQSLRSHQSHHLEEMAFKCTWCDKAFRTRNLLCAHSTTHNREVKCDECGSVFKSKRAFYLHKNKGHLDKVGMDQQDQSFSKLTSHPLNKSKVNSHACELCKIHLSSKSLMKRHLKTHKVTLQVCGICNQKFLTPALLEAHFQHHTDRGPFKCSKCGEEFNSQITLESHQSHHLEEKVWKCSQCIETFISETLLHAHMRIHNQDLNCHLTFTPQESLEEHILTHTEDYTCEMCFMSFPSAIPYSNHKEAGFCTTDLSNMVVASEIVL